MRNEIWKPVQENHIELKKLSLESIMYVSKITIQEMEPLTKTVQDLSNRTRAFDENVVYKQLDLIAPLIEKCRESALLVANEGRKFIE